MKCLLSNRKLTTAIILSIVVVMIFVATLVLKNYYEDVPTINICLITTQIVSALFVIAGVIIAVWQYYIDSRSRQSNMEKDKIQYAISLSQYYKDNILSKYAALNYVYEKSGFNRIGKVKDINENSQFNVNELNLLFTQEEREEIKNIPKKTTFINAVLEANTIYDLKLNINQVKHCDENDGNGKKISLLVEPLIESFISRYVSDTLNNMEYFAMNFTHKVADESVVFQSLNHTFIDLTEMMYYHIASINGTEDGKYYYTNLSELYKIWKRKAKEQNRKMINASASCISKGTVHEEIHI